MVSISDLYEFVKTSDNNFTSPKVKNFLTKLQPRRLRNYTKRKTISVTKTKKDPSSVAKPASEIAASISAFSPVDNSISETEEKVNKYIGKTKIHFFRSPLKDGGYVWKTRSKIPKGCGKLPYQKVYFSDISTANCVFIVPKVNLLPRKTDFYTQKATTELYNPSKKAQIFHNGKV